MLTPEELNGWEPEALEREWQMLVAKDGFQSNVAAMRLLAKHESPPVDLIAEMVERVAKEAFEYNGLYWAQASDSTQKAWINGVRAGFEIGIELSKGGEA